MIKNHQYLFIASLIIAVIGAYVFISSDKHTGKYLLIAGAVGQVYHLVAYLMINKKTKSVQ
jgi:hypothetical protein